MSRLDMAIVGVLMTLHRCAYFNAELATRFFCYYLGIGAHHSLKEFVSWGQNLLSCYLGFAFRHKSNRLRLIIRQNDFRFNEAIKWYLGDRDNGSIDLRKLYNIPIEEIYENSNRRIHAFLGIYRQRLNCIVEMMLKAQLFSIQHTSVVVLIVATYITKYIYLNGGFVNYARI